MADKNPAPANPFEEFGGSAEEAFAEFGGGVETPTDEAPIEFNTSLDPIASPGTLTEQQVTAGAERGAGQSIVDAATGFATGIGEGALLGMKKPLDYASAGLVYAGDALNPNREADFGKALEQVSDVRKDIAEDAGGFNTAGQVVGAVGSSLATGGFGATALTAKAGSTVAKLGGASLLGKLAGLGATGRAAATVTGAGAALATEGAIEGTVAATAKEIDDTIEKGDWKNLGSKLYASVPAGALEGAKWNAIIGGGLQLGIKGVQTAAAKRAASAQKELGQSTLRVGNAAQPNLQTAHIYDEARPLRASEAIDQAPPEVIALRKQTTPEVAKIVQDEEAQEIIKLYNESLELDASLDHALRLNTKTSYLKEMQNEWVGPSIDDMLAQAGLDDRTLRSLERSAQGEGGSMVANLRKKIARARQDLPGIKEEIVDSAPKGRGGARELDLEGAEAAPEVKRSGRNPTVGEMAAAMDGIKRAAQKVAAKSRFKNPLIHEALLDPSEALRLNLEDSALWGAKFAEDQAVINKRWSDHINASKQLDGALSTEGRVSAKAVGGDDYDVLEVADENKLRGLLSDIGTGKNEQLEEAFKANLRAKELSFGERLRWGGLEDADNRVKVARLAEINRELENRLNKVGLANRYAVENSARTPETPIGAAVGKLFEGIEKTPFVGGVLGTPREALKAWREASATQNSSAAFGIKRAMVKAQERLNKATKIKVKVDKAVPAVKGAVPGVNVNMVRSELERLDATEDPDSEASLGMQSRLQQLEEHAGQELAQAYIERMQARDAFLRDKAGPPPEPTPFGTPERVLDDDTSATLARYIRAVDDPMGALERMRDGEATAEDEETLQQMYPELLQEWRDKAMAAVTNSKSKYTADEQEELAGRLGISLDGDIGESLAFWQQVSATGTDEQGNHTPTPTSMGKFKIDGDQVSSRSDRLAT